jgi:hypothetical protein
MMQKSLFEHLGLAPDNGRRIRETSECSDDLEIGKAAEHLVCADLILSGYRAFLSDQGLAYDILVDIGGRFLRVQVKATRKPKNHDPKTRVTPGYFFHLRRAGKGGNRRYPKNAFDMYALVALDRQAIAYLPARDCPNQTIALRVPGESYLQSGSLNREFNTASFRTALERVGLSESFGIAE